MTAADSWQPPQLREALARLEEAEVSLDHTVVAAKHLEQNTPKTALSEEDIERIEEHTRGGDAPRELQERIDDGELSWGDIAAGRLGDPGCRARSPRVWTACTRRTP